MRERVCSLLETLLIGVQSDQNPNAFIAIVSDSIM